MIIFNIMNNLEIAEYLIARRKTLAVSQSRLAELSGVSVHTISNLETATGNVTLATLQKVCATMGLSVSVNV